MKPPIDKSLRMRTVFVTGTDTAVGKTVLTALLLAYLREEGWNALAMKPFSAGSLADARLFNRLQDKLLPMNLLAPFRFQDPVAPLVSVRKYRRRITLRQVLDRIHQVERRCDRLLVEGVGGLLVPLAEGFGVAQVIQRLACPVIVVARNRLGAINHTLLTVEMLRKLRVERIKVVLMDRTSWDESCRTNQEILADLVAPIEVLSLPCLGRTALGAKSIRNNCKKFKKTLASLSDLK